MLGQYCEHLPVITITIQEPNIQEPNIQEPNIRIKSDYYLAERDIFREILFQVFSPGSVDS